MEPSFLKFFEDFLKICVFLLKLLFDSWYFKMLRVFTEVYNSLINLTALTEAIVYIK